MPLDLTKPLRVRYADGKMFDVTDIVDVSDSCIHAYFVRPGDLSKTQITFTGREGYSQAHPQMRLENIPERKVWERWVNVYECGPSWVHRSRRDADEGAAANGGTTRTECLHIRHEYEPGEGL